MSSRNGNFVERALLISRKLTINPGIWPLLPIVVGFIVSSVGFSVTVPLLEAPDEPSHVAVVRYIRTHGSLPVQKLPSDFPAGQEGSQPPLYYALGSLLWRLAPGPDLAPGFTDQNPFVSFARAPEPIGNRNLFAHAPSEDYPYAGDVLAIHLVRLLSVALGSITVGLTYLIARALFPERPFLAPFAAGLVGFNPQFAFIAGVVNNDSAIAATATLVLWCLVRWLRSGGSRALALTLGFGLGAAMLSKTSGILLLPVAAGGLMFDALLTRRYGDAIRRAVVVGILALAVAGWWFVGNVLRYGDALGWQTMLAANGGMIRSAPIDLVTAAVSLWNARGTFWGIFGWTNIPLSAQVYQDLDLASGVALVGLAVAFWRERIFTGEPRRALALALLVGWPPVVFMSLVRWVQINNAADQWRLMFAALGAIALLLALGFDEIRGIATGRLPWRPTTLAVTVFAIALAVVGVLVNYRITSDVVAPEYSPLVEASSATPSLPTLTFGSDIELVGYDVRPARLAPGEPLQVDLRWRARRPIQQNWRVALSVVGSADAPLAKVEAWPQNGRAPTRAWRVGLTYDDHYTLTPRWQGDNPQLAKVFVSLYDGSVAGIAGLPVFDARTQMTTNGVAVAQVTLKPSVELTSTPQHAVSARFDSSIDLLGYDSTQDGSLKVKLFWRARAPIDKSLTVFVHLIATPYAVVAQHDGLPVGGGYPTTVWDSTETIRDDHVISLDGVKPGQYQVAVGMYRFETGKRVSAVDTSGEPVVDDGVRLFTVMVK